MKTPFSSETTVKARKDFMKLIKRILEKMNNITCYNIRKMLFKREKELSFQSEEKEDSMGLAMKINDV